MEAITNFLNSFGPEIWAAIGGLFVWLAGFAKKKADALVAAKRKRDEHPPDPEPSS